MKASKNAMGGGARASKLLAAVAVLAVAFVVLAAVPAALTDSDATPSPGIYSDAAGKNSTTLGTSLEANTTIYVYGSWTFSQANVALGKYTLTIKECTDGNATVSFTSATGFTGTDGAKVVIDNDVDVTASQVITINPNVTLVGDVTLSGTTGGITLKADADAPGAMTGAVKVSGKTVLDLNGVTGEKASEGEDFTIVNATTTIQGTAQGTSMEIAGAVSLAASTTLGVNTKIDAGVTIAASSTALEIDGATLTVAGTLTGTAVTNSGKVIVADRGDITGVTFAAKSTGTIDRTSDESEMDEVEIKGRIQGTNTYSKDQIVTVTANSAIAESAVLNVYGKLVIPEGVTLTVEKRAQLVLDQFATLVIEGTLVIDEKADSGDADNTTGLTVTKGYVEVYGSIVASRPVSVAAGALDIETDGIMTVAEVGSLAITAGTATVTVKKSGTLTINGDLSGTVYNEGLVTYDSDVAGTGATINMMKAGATVDVVKFTVLGADSITAKLVISDKYLVESTYTDTSSRLTKNVTDTDQEDKVTIAPGYTDDGQKTTIAQYLFSVTDIKLVSGTTNKSTSGTDATAGCNPVTKKQFSKNLGISGSIEASMALKEDGTAGQEKFTATGTITLDDDASHTNHTSFKVSGELSVGDNITLTNTGVMKVTGIVSVGSADATLTNSSSITVSSNGGVSVVKNPISTGITATMYKTTAKDSAGKNVDTYHYVDINKALTVVSAEGSAVTELTLMDEQTISASAELPTGVTLNVDKALKISKDDEEIMFSVAEGATVKGSAKITVVDTMFAENKKDIKDTNIDSDVKTEEIGEDGKTVKDGWAMWTNLSVALSDAASGDIIEITGTEVDVTSNMTIADGVTVRLPGTSTMVLASGVTLTIDGVLQADGSVKAQSAFDLTATKIENTDTVGTGNGKYSSAIVVSGKLMLKGVADYGNGTYTLKESTTEVDVTDGAPIAGLYYTEGEYSVIAGIEAALSDVSDIVGDIIVNGKVSGGDYSVEATSAFYEIIVDDDNVYVGMESGAESSTTTVETSLTVKSLTLDGVTLDVDGLFTGSVYYADASVSAANASGFDLYEKDSKAYVSGAIDIEATGSSFSVASGKVYTGSITAVSVYTLTSDTKKNTSMTVASGAELIVDESVSGVERMTVDGTLTVPAVKSMSVVYLQVNGTVSVAAATATTSAGTLSIQGSFDSNDTPTATVKGALFVGISMTNAGAGAVYNGPVELDTNAKAVVATGAAVDDAFVASVEDLATTAFYVDGSVWITAYAGGDSVTIYYPIPSKANVSPKGWASYEGGINVETSYTYTIGEYPSLYYVYETVIYKIVITADEGIDNVYLNGQAMAYGLVPYDSSSTSAGYYYAYTSTVAAGNYKVTYTLKNGYSGTATLALNGTSSSYTVASVSGASFDVSGSEGDVNLQLTGIEKSGYVQPTEDKKDTGLTVTDYLLIVLVILVVVLAVIVAMRLMRS